MAGEGEIKEERRLEEKPQALLQCRLGLETYSEVLNTPVCGAGLKEEDAIKDKDYSYICCK